MKIKLEPTFEDDDLMYFGKHKGECFGDIPVEYFHWIWTNKVYAGNIRMENYLKNNMDALKMENKDLIWT